MTEAELRYLEHHMKSMKINEGNPSFDFSRKNSLSKYAIEEAKTANKANQQFLQGVLKIATKLNVVS